MPYLLLIFYQICLNPKLINIIFPWKLREKIQLNSVYTVIGKDWLNSCGFLTWFTWVKLLPEKWWVQTYWQQYELLLANRNSGCLCMRSTCLWENLPCEPLFISITVHSSLTYKIDIDLVTSYFFSLFFQAMVIKFPFLRTNVESWRDEEYSI